MGRSEGRSALRRAKEQDALDEVRFDVEHVDAVRMRRRIDGDPEADDEVRRAVLVVTAEARVVDDALVGGARREVDADAAAAGKIDFAMPEIGPDAVDRERLEDDVPGAEDQGIDFARGDFDLDLDADGPIDDELRGGRQGDDLQDEAFGDAFRHLVPARGRGFVFETDPAAGRIRAQERAKLVQGHGYLLWRVSV